MFLNEAYLVGRSGIARLMYTSLIILLLIGVFGTVSAQDGGVLVVGMNTPENLDPATGSNDPEILLNRTIYDFLVETRPDGTLMPNLATGWEISEDELTYTFALAEGVTFHDGSEFSSADVVFTFNRLQELEAQAATLMGPYEVSAPDANTVVFTLPEINADFLFGVATSGAVILKGGTETPNTLSDGDHPYANFVGTGPFVLTDYSAGQHAIFEPNANYWKDGEPQLSGLEFLFIDDPQAQIDALRSGAVHFIFKIGADRVANLEGDDDINIIQIATNLHPLIRIRSDEGALGEDVRIRQAFKLATNREELLDTVQEGLGVVGHNDPIGPKYGEYYDDSLPMPEYDPEAACALIEEVLGEGERVSTDFYVVNSFNYESLGVALQQQWADACIDVNLLVREEGIYYAETEWLEVDLGITGWGDRAIPQPLLTSAYHTDGPWNETHFSDAELDDLIEMAGTTTDLDERAAIYSRISTVFAERGPIIIPWFASVIGATTSSVEGLEMHPFAGLTDFRNVTVN